MTTIDRRVDISRLSLDTQKSLKTAKTSDDVLKVLAKDGKIDENEKAVLDEVVAELTADNSDGILTFEGSGFEVKALKFDPTKASELHSKAESKADAKTGELLQLRMDKRTTLFQSVSSVGDLQRMLTGDQSLLDNMQNKYGNATKAKILLQDGFLLERFGVLSESEKQTLTSMVEKLSSKNQQYGFENGTDALTKDDVKQLDVLIENVMSRLEGASGLEGANTTELFALGPSNTASPDEQSEVVDKNFDGLNAQIDASIHDLDLSYHERAGAASDKLDGSGIMFDRVEKSIHEVESNIHLLQDNVMPTLEKQIDSLETQINDRLAELEPHLKGADESTLKQAIALLSESDPKLAALVSKQTSALSKFSTLNGKLELLFAAQVKGIQRLQSAKTIYSEENQRVAAVNSTSAKLTKGTADLQILENQLRDLGKSMPNLPPNATFADQIKHAMALQNKPYEDLKSAEALMTKVQGIRQNMIDGLGDLIDVYKSKGTSNKQAIELLQKQLQTLETLKDAEPADMVAELQQVRQNVISTLSKDVPGLISKPEFMALTGLDQKVTTYSQADMKLTSATQGKITNLKEHIAELKEEQSHVLEKNASVLTKLDKYLAYDSHIGMELGFTVGLKAGLLGGLVEGYAGVGLSGEAKISKEFGIGPPYRAVVNLNFLAEAEGKALWGLVSFKAKYEKTLTGGGLGFNSPEDIKAFLKDLSHEADLNAAIDTLKDASEKMISKAAFGGFSADEKEKFAKIQVQIKKLEVELKSVEKKNEKTLEDHKITDFHNHKVDIEANVDPHAIKGKKGSVIGMFNQMPSIKGQYHYEDNTLTYKENGVEKKSETTKSSVLIEVNHVGVKVFSQSSAELGPNGAPTGHDKQRYGFHIMIPPAKLGAIVQKGASLTATLGKETMFKIAEQIVGVVSKADPGCGLTAAMVVALLEKQWMAESATKTKHIEHLSKGAGAAHGVGGHDAHHGPFHQEFFVGADFIVEDGKYQYAALEAGWEGQLKFESDPKVVAGLKGGPIVEAGIAVKGYFKMDAEVAVQYQVHKSPDYLTKKLVKEAEFAMDVKGKSGPELLLMLSDRPEICKLPAVQDVLKYGMKDLKGQHGELLGKTDTEVLKMILANPEKYATNHNMFEILLHKTAGGGGH